MRHVQARQIAEAEIRTGRRALHMTHREHVAHGRDLGGVEARKVQGRQAMALVEHVRHVRHLRGIPVGDFEDGEPGAAVKEVGHVDDAGGVQAAQLELRQPRAALEHGVHVIDLGGLEPAEAAGGLQAREAAAAGEHLAAVRREEDALGVRPPVADPVDQLEPDGLVRGLVVDAGPALALGIGKGGGIFLKARRAAQRQSILGIVDEGGPLGLVDGGPVGGELRRFGVQVQDGGGRRFALLQALPDLDDGDRAGHGRLVGDREGMEALLLVLRRLHVIGLVVLADPFLEGLAVDAHGAVLADDDKAARLIQHVGLRHGFLREDVAAGGQAREGDHAAVAGGGVLGKAHALVRARQVEDRSGDALRREQVEFPELEAVERLVDDGVGVALQRVHDVPVFILIVEADHAGRVALEGVDNVGDDGVVRGDLPHLIFAQLEVADLQNAVRLGGDLKADLVVVARIAVDGELHARSHDDAVAPVHGLHLHDVQIAVDARRVADVPQAVNESDDLFAVYVVDRIVVAVAVLVVGADLRRAVARDGDGHGDLERLIVRRAGNLRQRIGAAREIAEVEDAVFPGGQLDLNRLIVLVEELVALQPEGDARHRDDVAVVVLVLLHVQLQQIQIAHLVVGDLRVVLEVERGHAPLVVEFDAVPQPDIVVGRGRLRVARHRVGRTHERRHGQGRLGWKLKAIPVPVPAHVDGPGLRLIQVRVIGPARHRPAGEVIVAVDSQRGDPYRVAPIIDHGRDAVALEHGEIEAQKRAVPVGADAAAGFKVFQRVNEDQLIRPGGGVRGKADAVGVVLAAVGDGTVGIVAARTDLLVQAEIAGHQRLNVVRGLRVGKAVRARGVRIQVAQQSPVDDAGGGAAVGIASAEILVARLIGYAVALMVAVFGDAVPGVIRGVADGVFVVRGDVDADRQHRPCASLVVAALRNGIFACLEALAVIGEDRQRGHVQLAADGQQVIKHASLLLDIGPAVVVEIVLVKLDAPVQAAALPERIVGKGDGLADVVPPVDAHDVVVAAHRALVDRAAVAPGDGARGGVAHHDLVLGLRVGHGDRLGHGVIGIGGLALDRHIGIGAQRRGIEGVAVHQAVARAVLAVEVDHRAGAHNVVFRAGGQNVPRAAAELVVGHVDIVSSVAELGPDLDHVRLAPVVRRGVMQVVDLLHVVIDRNLHGPDQVHALKVEVIRGQHVTVWADERAHPDSVVLQREGDGIHPVGIGIVGIRARGQSVRVDRAADTGEVGQVADGDRAGHADSVAGGVGHIIMVAVQAVGADMLRRGGPVVVAVQAVLGHAQVADRGRREHGLPVDPHALRLRFGRAVIVIVDGLDRDGDVVGQRIGLQILVLGLGMPGDDIVDPGAGKRLVSQLEVAVAVDQAVAALALAADGHDVGRRLVKDVRKIQRVVARGRDVADDLPYQIIVVVGVRGSRAPLARLPAAEHLVGRLLGGGVHPGVGVDMYILRGGSSSRPQQYPV